MQLFVSLEKGSYSFRNHLFLNQYSLLRFSCLFKGLIAYQAGSATRFLCFTLLFTIVTHKSGVGSPLFIFFIDIAFALSSDMTCLNNKNGDLSLCYIFFFSKMRLKEATRYTKLSYNLGSNFKLVLYICQ